MTLIGKRVRISEAGRAKYPDAPANPHGSIGICTSPRYGGDFSVEWGNGERNEYRAGEIEAAQ